MFSTLIGSESYIIIKLNNIYNYSRIWGKKKTLKKAKAKLVITQSKSDILYKDGSIFNQY